MDVTVYLPDDTGKWAKEHDLPMSRMLRAAVDAERKRRATLDETKGKATTFELRAQQPNEYGGFDDFTARLHGTLIASQELGGGYGSVDVYLGDNDKIYIHDHEGTLYRDVDLDLLRHHVNEATYVEAMAALGQEPVIDIGTDE